jgi:acetyl esterase/lipase
MPFDHLPPQTPLLESGDIYAAKALALSREAVGECRTVLDVSYVGDGGDYWRSLDLWLPPEKDAQGVPVLLYMHGGGFTHGYKEWCGLNALPLVDLPAIVISVNYRLAPQHRLPTGIEDCADALAWTVRNIAQYGGDPRRIAIGGHSAGGHLAASVVLRHDLLAARGLGPDTITACFPVSCSYNLRYSSPVPGTAEYKTTTQVLRDPDDAAAMSPLTHVAGNATPFFLAWGSRDLERARRTGAEMLAALQTQPGKVEHHIFEGFDHFDMHLDQRNPGNAWVRKVRDWMARPPSR